MQLPLASQAQAVVQLVSTHQDRFDADDTGLQPELRHGVDPVL